MFTLCPSCLTVFRIQAAHLNVAGGQVRCDHCGSAFTAMGHLYDHVLDAQAARMGAQQARDAVAQPLEPSVEGDRDFVAQIDSCDSPECRVDYFTMAPPLPPTLEGDADFVAQVDPCNSPEAVPLPLPVAPLAPSADGDRDFFAQLAPFDSPEVPPALPACFDDWDAFGQPAEFVLPIVPETAHADLEVRDEIEAELLAELEEAPRKVLSRGTWWGLAASLLLMLVFAGQFVYVNRDQWADDARWRPWLETLCQVSGCKLPLRRDVARIELLERDVRDHPQVDNAVLINASFINRAEFEQAYPVFEVGFSDLSGTTVAQRRFPPEEYLGSPVPEGGGLRPNEVVNVHLEVLDPGRRAVSFKLEFL